MWSPVLEFAGRGRDVVALDLPGFGGSAPLAGEVTLAALADVVWELVETLGIERPHVAGNSLARRGRAGARVQRTGAQRERANAISRPRAKPSGDADA